MNKEFIKVLATILGTVRIDKKGKELQEPNKGGLSYNEYLKTYQEAPEVIRLVSLSEFVSIDQDNLYLSDFDILMDVVNYKDFITQQLTKGQLDLVHAIMYVDFNINCVYSSSFSMLHLLEILEVKTIEQAINNGVTLYLKIKR